MKSSPQTNLIKIFSEIGGLLAIIKFTTLLFTLHNKYRFEKAIRNIFPDISTSKEKSSQPRALTLPPIFQQSSQSLSEVDTSLKKMRRNQTSAIPQKLTSTETI